MEVWNEEGENVVRDGFWVLFVWIVVLFGIVRGVMV